ncbi:hypothetical protein [Burkholderia sp. LMG 32019]|uniref:hypothetical protein n=1 Tax=Burkholderia sp. LMG 32019 TaxID=3158173 RepID=UPI003C2F9DBB
MRDAIRAGRMGLAATGAPGGSTRRVGPHAGMGIFISVAPVRMPRAAFARLAQDNAPVTLDEALVRASTSAG